MTTELAFDMMTRILPDVVEIVNDPELVKAKAEAQKAGKTFKQAMGDMLPLFLQDHREAVQRIFAAVQGKSLEDVKAQASPDLSAKQHQAQQSSACRLV